VQFELRYHPTVKLHDIPRLDQKARERIRKAIESRLMTAPHEYGLPLRKNLKGYWKLRVGDYRVVFRIAGSEVFVLCIRHRKDVYEIMSERVSRHS
jgi:mRNA interferase RelE/StbE